MLPLHQAKSYTSTPIPTGALDILGDQIECIKPLIKQLCKAVYDRFVGSRWCNLGDGVSHSGASALHFVS